MPHKTRKGVALPALIFMLVSAMPAAAQPVSAFSGEGMARNWSNLAGFTNSCIERKLLDGTHLKYARFFGNLGGFILGSIHRNEDAALKALSRYQAEAAQGRVHEFDEKGVLTAYDLEFNKETCAMVSNTMRSAYDQFVKDMR
jgi:hypothetical protein